MKKNKYIVKESNGWYYAGRYYIEGSIIELTDDEYKSLGNVVKLVPVADSKAPDNGSARRVEGK